MGVPDQAPGGGPGRSSRGISGAPLDVCQPAPAQITTTSLSPGAPKGQACEGVDNGGTVLAGSGPRGSNSTVLARGTDYSPLGSPPAAGVWSRPPGQEQHRPRLHPHENTRRAPFVPHEDLPPLIGNSDPAHSP